MATSPKSLRAQPTSRRSTADLSPLLSEIRSCQLCAEAFAATPTSHPPRPVFQPGRGASIVLIGQAPGWRAHSSETPFDDPSGDRLRAWLGVDRRTFYDPRCFAILPMAFCFPGHDAKGGDRPPPKRCAATWRSRLFRALPRYELMLLIGSYAVSWHAPELRGKNLSEIVGPAPPAPGGPLADAEERVVLPHPSWRNTAWLKRRPHVEAEIIPSVRRRVAAILERTRHPANLRKG